ncbi:hypothetical protein [Granulosicoccus antarcticus]|uniref:MAE-28990/MAE-18760-like HEPN domain-containing protein n=1 Tax=Granulosicoccus antarcticus IMCC3135 TaxID=1192854 RepID=A0A2Z2NL88_9GAMM|nr:hypothetical protein [Granulosicoccus antarcticus]ASJ72096.1 hypothetical protein IMCC3135_10010 [Granulosicoccus antarcticus IMCC3135]
MTTLNEPILGTPKDTGWPYYDHQMMTSHLLREYFDTLNYKSSIGLAVRHGEAFSKFIDSRTTTGSENQKKADLLKKQAVELSSWAVTMKDEGFHDLHVHAFIGIWSSFEAGIENIIATYVERDDDIAEKVIDLFMPKQVSPDARPWSRASSLAVAKRIERLAMKDVSVKRTDVSARYAKMFYFLGLDVEVRDSDAAILAEANCVRNILLHRYGKIESSDVEAFPSLAKWEGKVMHMDQEKFTQYFNSIKTFLMALFDGINAKWPPVA